MRGMVLTGHGGLDRLEWRDDLPVPTPRPGEVLIQVNASAINNTDVTTRTGWYSRSVRGDTASGAAEGYGSTVANAEGSWAGKPLSFPLVQGADCCGRIVAAGPEVDARRIGERVLVRALQSRTSSNGRAKQFTFGSECDGGFAEYAVTPSADALAVNSELSDVELASFPYAFSAAEGMVQRCGLGTESVLVSGASGGVGCAAIQLAKRRGARVTALTTAEKAADLLALGADETLDREAPLPCREFDVVLDLVGGPRWPDLIESLHNGGRYVVSGAIAGPIVELDLRTLYVRDLSLIGNTYQPDNIFPDVIGYIETGEIRPVLAATYPLEQLRTAQEAFLSKSHIGKIGITVAD